MGEIVLACLNRALRNCHFVHVLYLKHCPTVSHLDRPFVKKEVLQYLEDECGLKLCVHERDFLGGAAIAANICAAIEHSRRMVMVVSRYKNLISTL